jgi:hypothetical protein
MNQPSEHNNNLGWLQLMPLIMIVVFAIMLWRPETDAVPTQEQEAKIADLAARLGSPSSSANAIDDRLRSFGPFPPDAKASRALAEALVTCGTAKLDNVQRNQFARQLYGITVIGDERAKVIPEALIGMQKSAAAAGCTPPAIDQLMSAARAVISTDPNPRRDWW